MSTRWYPLYQRGNPQLRVFLPNFWMKLIKPEKEGPSNEVHFSCSMEMTKFDINNYLTKIYKIPVVDLHVRIKTGEFRNATGANYVVKDEDEKIAIVTLPATEKFVFPDLFATDEASKELEKNKEDVKIIKEEWRKKSKLSSLRPGIPSWFGL